MAKHILIIYLLFASASFLGVHPTHTCDIEDVLSNCVYTVVCETYVGNASIPNCDSDPYVTFVIRKSTAYILSESFLRWLNFNWNVRAIIANENNWNTLERLVFPYYHYAEYMDISNNRIKHLENFTFAGLVNLKTLNISRNQISYLELSSLYTHYRDDSDITSLILSLNNLEYLQSGVFKFMTKLRQLDLRSNKINGLPDDVFKNLKNLTRLELQHNNLTAFNRTLFNFKSLVYLDASFNNLIRLSGYELNRLISLILANFSNNAIETLESNCFNQALKLEVLDLKNNKIKSVIENIMFINNVKLRYLDLGSNLITKIEDNAFKPIDLNYLNLEKNNISSGSINEVISFAGWTDIEKLSLYNQSITSLNHGAFSDMISLKVLNLSRNSISAIDSSCFVLMKNLSILDLSHNLISDLYFVENSLTNLTELILKNNKLTKINSHQFVNQTQLKKLDLSMNNINTIERYSLPLDNLQYLNVAGNSLTGGIEPDTFSPAKYLRNLDLSNCNLSKINNMPFFDLPVLTGLNLSNNLIDDIEFNNFIGVNKLYSLDLSHNRLKMLELKNELNISININNLKYLYLNNNNFKTLPKVNVPDIVYLDLSYNSIKNVSGTFFKQLQNLKTLNMSFNRITHFNNNYINSLTELLDLSLSHNEITVVNMSFFKKLINLNISYNRLNNIKKHFLLYMDNLQDLDLSNNNITELPPATFQYTKILKMLNLSSNNLSNLRYGSLRGLHRIEVLDLSKNEIKKLDVDIFHECVELKKLVIDYNHIKYIDFERLLFVTPKLILISLGGNPLSCKQIVRNMRSANNTLSHLLEVTSIDKIYHEDNVHGIKCGNVNNSTTTIIGPEDTEISLLQRPSALVHFIWSTLIILIVILGFGGIIYYKYYGYQYSDNFSALRLRRSQDFSNFSIDNIF